MPENNKPLDPRSAIAAEAGKARKAPRHIGLLSVKAANDWIEESLLAPDPKTYFHDLIVQYENTVIFASSNVGKSILAIQIAEDIARSEKIMYVDLELSAKQFQMRYTDPTTGYRHIFPANFTRAEVAPELIVGADLEQEILSSIEEAARQGTRFFVIDNITFICNDSEKGSTAGSFMMKLISLKKLYALTTVVIAHTPKRRGWEPITQNDLAGSAKLINFFDAGIALARSAKDDRLRYLKQVKVRTGEYRYDSDNVIILDIAKTDGCLRFRPVADHQGIERKVGNGGKHCLKGGGKPRKQDVRPRLPCRAPKARGKGKHAFPAVSDAQHREIKGGGKVREKGGDCRPADSPSQPERENEKGIQHHIQHPAEREPQSRVKGSPLPAQHSRHNHIEHRGQCPQHHHPEKIGAGGVVQLLGGAEQAEKRLAEKEHRKGEQADNKPPAPKGKTGGVAGAPGVFGTECFGNTVSGTDSEQVAERGQCQLCGKYDGKCRQLGVIPGFAHKKGVG